MRLASALPPLSARARRALQGALIALACAAPALAAAGAEEREGSSRAVAVIEFKGNRVTENATRFLLAAVSDPAGPVIGTRSYEVQKGDSVCLIFRRAFSLPGCSPDHALRLFGHLNPKSAGGKEPVLPVGQPVRLPDVQAEAFKYNVRIDPNSLERDARRGLIVSKERSWRNLEFSAARQSSGDVTVVTLTGVRLTTAPVENPAHLTALYRHVHELKDPDTSVHLATVPAKTLYTSRFVPPAQVSLSCDAASGGAALPDVAEDVAEEDAGGVDGAYWKLLPWLADWEPPDCALDCPHGTRCPTVVLPDTVPYRHPELAHRVIRLTASRDRIPPGVDGPECAVVDSAGGAAGPCMVDFVAECHHGTSLASIIASRPDRRGFAGVTPSANIVAFDWYNASTDDLVSLITERMSAEYHGRHGPQLFAFASKFPEDVADQFSPESSRSGHAFSYKSIGEFFPTNENVVDIDPNTNLLKEGPAEHCHGFERRFCNKLASEIESQGPLWITAAGQVPEPSESQPDPQPVRLRERTPLAPMNLGDLPNVITVTTCDPCDGTGGGIWPKANHSRDMVHVAAPGLRLTTPADSRRFAMVGGGTSQSTAFVAGVVSGMLSCHPDRFLVGEANLIDHETVKRWLQLTSRPLVDATGRKRLAAGIVDPSIAFLDPGEYWFKPRDRGPEDPEYVAAERLEWCAEELDMIDIESGERTPLRTWSILRMMKVSSGGPDRWFVYTRSSDPRRRADVERRGPLLLAPGAGGRLVRLDGETFGPAEIDDIVSGPTKNPRLAACSTDVTSAGPESEEHASGGSRGGTIR